MTTKFYQLTAGGIGIGGSFDTWAEAEAARNELQCSDDVQIEAIDCCDAYDPCPCGAQDEPAADWDGFNMRCLETLGWPQ